MSERVVDIVEKFLAARVIDEPIPEEQIRQRVKFTNVPEDEIETILIEMEYEWDREKLNQFEFKKATKKLYLGIIGVACIFILMIASALFGFISNRINLLPYGLMAASFLIASQGYFQIKKSKMVKERREIKWRVYDKYQRN
jgi:hypothetical protein